MPGEQDVLTERLDACDRNIGLEESCLANLQMTKAGLMQDLLTGKVRVNVDEAEEVTSDV
jgi:hypothetical protein